MRVIFLDVDGVLNSIQSRTILALSKGALRRLAVLVKLTGAQIVVSSTWRKTTTYYGSSAWRRLQRALRYRGIEIYSKTPEIDGVMRGEEIAQWLSANRGWELDSYVILDDLPREAFYMSQWPHLVQTSMATGLTEADVDRAIKILDGKAERP